MRVPGRNWPAGDAARGCSKWHRPVRGRSDRPLDSIPPPCSPLRSTPETSMRALLLSAVLAIGSVLGAHAQTAEVTATCHDGTNWSGASRRGACSGHQGVQAFGTGPAAAAPAGGPVANPLAPATGPASPSSNSAAIPPARILPPAAQPRAGASGATTTGAPGQVWVNTRSKVYHCAGDRNYGKTARGEYMSEDAAKAAGDRPSRGKACS